MTTTLGEWHASGVKVGEVLAALDALRRGSTVAATRTSVVNFVVLAATSDDAATAASALAHFGGRHPGRTIVLVPGGDDPARVDASVVLVGSEVEGSCLWSEQVTLSACGPLRDHLDSLIEPFTLPDLPVVVWFVSALPSLSDPLLGAADIVLVDTRELGDLSCFPPVATLARQRTVLDLSWMRLRPWRELLAARYNGAPVLHATVTGKQGPRHILAGWLTSRLGLARSAVTLVDARHVSIRLVSEGAEFEVAYEDVQPLPDDLLAWSLAHALTHLERDRVWEQALRASLQFAP
jgi:glucose-6-phosphate dehydrogenase assembly protein OpcA